MLCTKWKIVFLDMVYNEEMRVIESDLMPRENDEVVIDGIVYLVNKVRFNVDIGTIYIRLAGSRI